MLGKIEGKMRRGLPEDERVREYHRLSGHEFEQTLEDSEGQGSPACCSPWGRKESDMTEQPNSSNNSSLPAYLPHSLCQHPGDKAM